MMTKEHKTPTRKASVDRSNGLWVMSKKKETNRDTNNWVKRSYRDNPIEGGFKSHYKIFENNDSQKIRFDNIVHIYANAREYWLEKADINNPTLHWIETLDALYQSEERLIKAKTTNLIQTNSALELENLIKKANRILELKFDWDDDGAEPIDSKLFGTTITFLRDYYYYLLKNFNNQISLPEISPCPDGSIDLDWHTPNAQLLINISKNNEKGDFIAHYYGDRFNDEVTKGSIPTHTFSESLAVWMKYLN